MSGRTATVNPLMVCGLNRLFITDSTIAGASAGVGAIASIRCLNVHTPLRGSIEPGVNTVRIGSSTTETSRIINSRAMLTLQPLASTTVTLSSRDVKKPATLSNTPIWNGIVKPVGTERAGVAVTVRCAVAPLAIGGVLVWLNEGGFSVSRGSNAKGCMVNTAEPHRAALLLVIATSNEAATPAGVSALLGVTTTPGGCGKHSSAFTSPAVSACVANSVLSIAPLNRRSEPSLPIST